MAFGGRLAKLLGIEYPIIQGPLGGMLSQKLTADVSNFGGLGSLGANSLAPEVIRDVIAEIRAQLVKPEDDYRWQEHLAEVLAGVEASGEELDRATVEAILHLNRHLNRRAAPRCV